MALLIKQYDDESGDEPTEGDWPQCVVIYDAPDDDDYNSDHILTVLTNDEAKGLIYDLVTRCELNWTGEFAQSVIDELADYAAQG